MYCFEGNIEIDRENALKLGHLVFFELRLRFMVEFHEKINGEHANSGWPLFLENVFP